MQEKEHSLNRTGHSPIKFIGRVIGQGSSRVPGKSTRWTDVDIYRAEGGNYVAHVRQCTQCEAESDRFRALSRATPRELMDWLRDGEKTLGKASQEACANAAENDSAWTAAWQETVE